MISLQLKTLINQFSQEELGAWVKYVWKTFLEHPEPQSVKVSSVRSLLEERIYDRKVELLSQVYWYSSDLYKTKF